MVIGICDDDESWRNEARRIIAGYGERQDLPFQMVCFNSGEDLLSYEGQVPEVLFLDIRLNDQKEEENGIEAAKAVNKRWPNCQIVYVTDYLYYAIEVYHTIHAFYMLKPQFEQRIGEIFEKVFHELEQSNRKMVFSVIGGKELLLSYSELLYLERQGRVTRIITNEEIYRTWEPLDEMVNRLPDLDFSQCHNSYVVYFPAVRRMNKDSYTMVNGDEVGISRSRRKKTREAFLRWAQTQIS